MACNVRKQSSQQKEFDQIDNSLQKQRSSIPTDVHQAPLDFQWPVVPVSSHTSHLHLTMMNQDPKDLHTARLIIGELRAKVRYQTEHIMKWRKAYAMQIHQHYRYQKEKTEQMNGLTSQLLLLESRLKRKQKQIATLLNHRELTIHRQQKIIYTLSSRLVDHGLETIDASYAMELDSLNDSDSAVVLEDIDSDSNITMGSRRRSSGSTDGISIVRSISDAIDTNLKYSVTRRSNCFLRRPDILETVYSVEEDPEPSTDLAEKRDKFRNRSEKALSSSLTEGQLDGTPSGSTTIIATVQEKTKDLPNGRTHIPSYSDTYVSQGVKIPRLYTTAATPTMNESDTVNVVADRSAKSQVTNFNRVMSNHRSVTKPKDVKYKRINKAKSKSLEELRGRLKNLVERGNGNMDIPHHGGYAPNLLVQTAQSYA